MKRTKKLWMSAAIALTMMFATAFGAAAQVADVNISSGDVIWNAYTGEKLSLTISGPSGNFHYDFEAGVNPSAGLFDKAGNLLQDGTYTWQLISIPEVSAEMKAARAAGEKVAAFEAVKQSGSFMVSGGSFVLPSEEATKPAAVNANKDQVFIDDLIVDGSACIGTDCANGENFSFDTLRLKENNLRIKFQDTSNENGNFPSTDWELLANESSNGSLDKFSIIDSSNSKTPFTIEANAPSNSLYVDDEGFVGMGTNSPIVQLHVQDGNSPALRLHQDGSSGFQTQIWDLAGNETNFFVRDVTNGSLLPFKILPGAPTNTLYINGSGNVGIGTANPDADLSVEGADGESKIYVEERTSTSGTYTLLELNATQNRPRFAITNGGANSNAGSTWNFDVLNDGNFAFINGGGGSVFTFETDGDLSIEGEFISGGSTLNVPDYVFADDYYLPTLDEVRTHIDTNSHLPGVPSAGEVVSEGLNVTEMQLTLLRKIEELTLYILEQDETIQELEKLRDRVATLEGGQQ